MGSLASTPLVGLWERLSIWSRQQRLTVDIFVVLPSAAGSLLLSLAPIYEYLRKRGYTEKHEHIVIGGWPVQFLPPADALEQEAVEEAVATEVEGVPTRVMTAEHLAAIALRTGRVKDHARVARFLEQKVVDRNRLRVLLERHGLIPQWEQFERRYMGGPRG